MSASSLSVIVRRRVSAEPAQVFQAWTSPEALKEGWGPAGIDCPQAEVDLRVGGRYRIANTLPDGSLLWIHGTFEEIVPDRKLVYSWTSDEHQLSPERVVVHFKPVTSGTEVIVIHERIAEQRAVDEHQIGCLDGLERFVATRWTAD